MRVIRYIDPEGNTHCGIEQDDGTSARRIAEPPLETLPRETGEIDRIHARLAPVEPPNIYCIGLNYRAHAAETGAPLPDYPVIFMKPTSTVGGPGEPIRLPAAQMQGPESDYECELAVVIGRPGRDIAEADALDHVAGYTAANDVSARNWQKNAGGGQWIRGKSFDTFLPLGPAMLTPDEIPDPQNLSIATHLSGETPQQSNTSDMIFTIPRIIAFLSKDTTLLPGTLILTGTPEGVGVARSPQRFLQPGDEVTIEIEKIGSLTNPVTAA